eukprot:18560-Heterococcus_DN1.PRE.1
MVCAAVPNRDRYCCSTSNCSSMSSYCDCCSCFALPATVVTAAYISALILLPDADLLRSVAAVLHALHLCKCCAQLCFRSSYALQIQYYHASLQHCQRETSCTDQQHRRDADSRCSVQLLRGELSRLACSSCKLDLPLL